MFVSFYVWLAGLLRGQMFQTWEGNDDWKELVNPEKYSLTNTQNIYITSDYFQPGEKIGGWWIRADPETYKTKKMVEEKASDKYTKVLHDMPELGTDDTVVILLHGNAKNRGASHRLAAYKLFQSQGYHTLTLDYRGYGDSVLEGEIGEDTLIQDAKAAMEFVRREVGDKAKLIIYGHSMGTGITSRSEKESGYRKLRVGRNNSTASLSKPSGQTEQEKPQVNSNSNFKRQSSLQFDRHSGRHFNRQSSLLSSLSDRCRGRRDSFSSWPGWYHGWIKKSRVEQLLADGPQGLFLMRNSTDFPGDLTLCVSNNGAVINYRVRRDNNKFTIDNVNYFTEIEELVTFYKSDNGGCVEKLEVGCGRDLSREEVKALVEDKPPSKFRTKRQKRDRIEMSEMLIINRE